ncbi:MAG: 16S rRNA (cytidine(1402)-2'-O)-methyltransferase [Elusimicrobia bacterium RIFCSPHIGHO2_01_FULL_64_10]|nr:MAG: 16S rRNA (cytidine(1402)-2'-O)-methyltransferase [Elusimicrobia bacterium RIFCSPHIGHO2_01_FULL_64_10]
MRERGTLYAVATPIGHMGDITLRALEVLKGADLIACEDTRRTLRLLNHYGISKPLLPVYAPKEKRQSAKILEALSLGKSVAMVTDAGTPGVSDPGSWLAREAAAGGYRVVPIPGPSAVSCAASVCGLASDGFIFLGFLPRKKSKIKRELEAAGRLKKAVIFFESPYRIAATLALAAETLGGDAPCWLGREMTKQFEETFRGTLAGVSEALSKKQVQGEVTVVIAP